MGYLNNHRVVDSDDPERIREILVSVYDAKSFAVVDDKTAFSAKAGLFGFGQCNLSYCSYGSATQVAFREDDYIRFQFAIAGTGASTVGAATTEVSAGVVVTTAAEARLTFGPAYHQLVLRIGNDSIQRDLVQLLGFRPKHDIAFASSTISDGGHAARFRAQVFHHAASLDITTDPIPAPLLREMDQIIRLKALFAIPNNFSDRIQAQQKDASAWQVRQIEEWIDAHWRDDVTIEKLVAVAGVSARSIFATFKRARGYGPMTYLKKVRLEAARRMLLADSPGATVTAIALACGFLNTGHFAKLYKAQYGELPSESRLRLRL